MNNLVNHFLGYDTLDSDEDRLKNIKNINKKLGNIGFNLWENRSCGVCIESSDIKSEIRQSFSCKDCNITRLERIHKVLIDFCKWYYKDYLPVKHAEGKAKTEKLRVLINDKLEQDGRFNRFKGGVGSDIWSTTDSLLNADGEEEVLGEFIRFKHELGGKGYGVVRITVYNPATNYNEGRIEMKIEISISSYCEWETFFEGFLSSPEDYHHIFKMIGLE